jgi:hypothetical protein
MNPKLEDEMALLAVEEGSSSVEKLRRFLLVPYDDMFEKRTACRLACRALVQKGSSGIDAMLSAIVEAPTLCAKNAIEVTTDFVVQRLDSEYVLVEIEKPQDRIFTSTTDFSAKFTHAFGQVIDFQDWVESHGEYARSLMPGVKSPKGILIMGRKLGLTERQIAKLNRFSLNSRNIEILTYDDVLNRARDLYDNIYSSIGSGTQAPQFEQLCS